MSHPASLPALLVRDAVTRALAEDLGLAGDITSQSTLPRGSTLVATMGAREAGIISGLALAAEAFAQSGPDVRFEALVADGDTVGPGTVVARIDGDARQALSGERVALNYLNHMSGIATLTARFVAEIAGTKSRICDTRKTTPGLRALEKYAVRCGGGSNHRFNLADAILIKDNHIAVAGGVKQAIDAAKRFAGHLVAIEIEVDTLDQLAEALEAGATAVLLDNMDNDRLRRAVALNAGRARLEASGGVTLERVRSIAETGVDFISSSRITMAAVPLDIGLDVEIQA